MHKKNTPNSAAATSSIVASEAARLRLEKMPSGTRGLSCRRSIHTKPTSSAADTARPARVRADPQPQSLALISVKTRAIVPSVMAVAPSRS